MKRASLSRCRAARSRFTRLAAEKLEDRSLLALVGYQIHLLPPEGSVAGPPLTQVNVGDSYDLAVTVQDLRPGPNAFPGVFAGYLDIGYDSSKTSVRVAEIQRIKITGATASTSGTFALTFNGETTAAIPFSANAATLAGNIQTALANLSGVGAGNVGVMVDVLSSPFVLDQVFERNLIFQVRFPGKFYDQNVANMTVASQSLAGGGNPAVSTTYDGDLAGGFNAVAFTEAFRSRANDAQYVNGLSAGNLPNVIDDVGAFANYLPTGTQPLELVRARLLATAAGSITFAPSLTNRVLPPHETLLYGIDGAIALADIDLGTAKTLTVGNPFTANADSVTVVEDAAATAIDVLANDIGVAGQSKSILSVTQPASGVVSFTAAGLMYKPNANFVGVDTFTYTATSGLSPNPAAGATATVTVIVTPVNDAPSFVLGVNQEANDESGPQSVAGFASAILAGPPDEAGQTLAFTLVASNPSLFAVQPAIDAAGKLTFTPALNSSGSAQVSVKLKDNGLTENGGVDESAAQTFTITIIKLHPLHNAALPLDSSGDFAITSIDALNCINYINAFGSGPVGEDGPLRANYVDTNADGHVTAADALAVINHINAFGPTIDPPLDGEGEMTALSADADLASLVTLLAIDAAEATRRRRGR